MCVIQKRLGNTGLNINLLLNVCCLYMPTAAEQLVVYKTFFFFLKV